LPAGIDNPGLRWHGHFGSDLPDDRQDSSSSPGSALRDILHHIELAASFSAGFDRDAFRHDIKTVYAVTRCLEIISEASRRLLV
jgi:hypothetical protein